MKLDTLFIGQQQTAFNLIPQVGVVVYLCVRVCVCVMEQ